MEDSTAAQEGQRNSGHGTSSPTEGRSGESRARQAGFDRRRSERHDCGHGESSEVSADSGVARRIVKSSIAAGEPERVEA